MCLTKVVLFHFVLIFQFAEIPNMAPAEKSVKQLRTENKWYDDSCTYKSKWTNSLHGNLFDFLRCRVKLIPEFILVFF